MSLTTAKTLSTESARKLRKRATRAVARAMFFIYDGTSQVGEIVATFRVTTIAVAPDAPRPGSSAWITQHGGFG